MSTAHERAQALRNELIGLLVLAGTDTEAIAAEVGLSASRCRLVARGAFIDAEPPSAGDAADRIAELRKLRAAASGIAAPTLAALALRNDGQIG